MADLRDEKLDFWLEKNKNVLFIGKHGVGKTTRAIEAFERAGINYRYFSGSTLDPWVDFIGVPREAVDEQGKKYLEFVMPKGLTEVEAIFMDELNRSHKKVMNAVMELIQFKSINGKKFNNLRVVWAAINPKDEGDYHVEELDPAQKGRFHVWCHVPYKLSIDYFKGKFGEVKAKGAVAWWNELPEPMKIEVDPRRLDYALTMYEDGGDMHDVLPQGCNVNKLLSNIKSGPIRDTLKKIFANNNKEDARNFLANENNYAAAMRYLTKDIPVTAKDDWMKFFLPLLNPEKLISLMSLDDKAGDFVLNMADKIPEFNKVVQDIVNAGQNRRLINRIKRVLGNNRVLTSSFGNLKNINADPPYFSKKTGVNWSNELVQLVAQPMNTTPQRVFVYNEIRAKIPPILSKDEALKTLEILNLVASRCHNSTVRSFKDLLGVTNHCIDQLHKATGWNWGVLVHNFGHKFEKLLKKLKENNVEHKILCP